VRIPLDPKRRFPVLAAIAAAAIVCLGRAVVMAAKDGWLASGQTAIGVASAARNATAYLAPVLGLSVLFAAIAWWGGRRPRLAGAIALLAAVPVAWMHVAVRLPLSEYHAPGFSGSRGLLAQGVAVAIAIFAVGVVVGSPPARLRSAVSGLAVAALLAAGIVRTFGSTAKDARPSVIVISLDTVRSDRLGCYGYPSGTTPAIDRLAETCVVFENASSPEAWTLTAHMTLMTSLRPLAHGVDENRPLPGSVPTLAETFRDAGYATAAVVDDVGWLHPVFGFDRGFDTYRRIPGDARAKNEALGAVLDDLQGGGASFLLLHYFDAHGDWGRQPYEAPEEDLRRFAGWYGGSFDGCDDRGRCGAELLRAWSDEGTPPPEDVRRYLSSLYDAGIAALDRDLGELFTELDRRGLLERSVVVLTADHGEEFFEHGLALHRQLYRECTAVPLLVRPPGGTAPRRVSTAVGLVDVAPTILDLAGIQRPDSMQ
jgi:arylsulfatase